jgi:flagellar basal body-associated protein FliL
MRLKKILIIIFSILIFIIVAGLITYKFIFSQSVIEGYTINKESNSKKILVATQGSSFKESVNEKLEEYYKNKDFYINVLDVTNLGTISDYNSYDKIIIISSVESSKINQEAENTINQISDKEKIKIITTSGSGSWDNYISDEIDTLSTVSKDENIKDVIDFIAE